VGDEYGAVHVDEQVIELDDRLPARGLGNETRDLDYRARIARVVDAQSRAEVRRVDDRVALERPRTVLMQVVRTEPQSVRRAVLRYREDRELARLALDRDVHEVDVLRCSGAIRIDGLIGRDYDASTAECECRV